MGCAEGNLSVTGLVGFTQMLTILLVPLQHECFLCEITLPNRAAEHPTNDPYIPEAPAAWMLTVWNRFVQPCCQAPGHCSRCADAYVAWTVCLKSTYAQLSWRGTFHWNKEVLYIYNCNHCRTPVFSPPSSTSNMGAINSWSMIESIRCRMAENAFLALSCSFSFSTSARNKRCVLSLYNSIPTPVAELFLWHGGPTTPSSTDPAEYYHHCRQWEVVKPTGSTQLSTSPSANLLVLSSSSFCGFPKKWISHRQAHASNKRTKITSSAFWLLSAWRRNLISGTK